MEEGFVYIIQSKKNGMYYIGSSKNPDKRLLEHNGGVTIATKNKGPWELKFIQKFPTLKKARQVEYRLKKLKRKDYIKQIIKDGYIKNIGL